MPVKCNVSDASLRSRHFEGLYCVYKFLRLVTGTIAYLDCQAGSLDTVAPGRVAAGSWRLAADEAVRSRHFTMG